MRSKQKLLVLLVLVLSLILAACDSGDDETPEPTEAPTEVVTEEPTEAPTEEPTEEVEPTEEIEATEQVAEAGTIVDEATANGDFTILVAAVEAAGLVDALSADGPLTVFAPTDAAFEAYFEASGMSQEDVLADTEALSSLLLYHVVDGEVLAEDVAAMDGESVTTLQGDAINISVTDDGVVLNGSVNVTQTDVMASNGVIHVVDAVLAPVMEEMEPTEEPTAEVEPTEEMEPTEEVMDTMEQTEEAPAETEEPTEVAMATEEPTEEAVATEETGRIPANDPTAEGATEEPMETEEPTEEAMATEEPTEAAPQPTDEPVENIPATDPTEEAMATEEAVATEESTTMGRITSVCMVADQGGIDDGTFNELAFNGVTRASEAFGLEMTVIESNTPSDFDPNIETCISSGYDAVVTVGFLITDATLAAAEANPDVYFIGVDQTFENPPENVMGMQFREDQAGFLVGVMAGMLTESNIVGGVYGIDIPPVVKFRNGFEQGVKYVNADVETLGVYISSFVDPATGADTAEQMLGQGADIIFGAGGATGSGGIQFAATQGVKVIGVDQDEYFTTFGGGESPGAENIISSATKFLDVGVYDMLDALTVGNIEWQGGSNYLLEAANDGIGYAPPHDADVPQEVLDRVAEVYEMLKSGELETGVDPITGAMLDAEPMEEAEPTEEPVEEMEPTEEAVATEETAAVSGRITSVCMVADQGGIDDGTFNELAFNGVTRASEAFGLEMTVIESNTPSDFDPNIETCISSGYDAVVTVGFLITDATLAAAEANPDVYFIGVDQTFENPPENVMGMQFREDQAGFLVGVMAGMLTESNIVGGVYGIDIPPVVKFRNGFEQGVKYVNADVETLGVYISSFVDPATGADTAEQMLGQGADIIFGAGGATGSGGIQFAATQGVKVIGVDQDEYFTTFGGGESPGAENIISSATKFLDVGVYDMLDALTVGNIEWQGGSNYLLEAANDGIGYAPPHDADVPQEVLDRVAEVYEMLKSGELETGVDPITGAMLDTESE